MNFQVISASIREGRLFWNRLEEAAFRIFPELRRMRERFREEAFLAVQLTGSGSTIFGACRGQVEAEAAAGRLERRLEETGFPGCRVTAAASLPSW